ncbi:MAG: rRNA pseudouridine synthase [Oscillospiraceae bacterium]|nr:rRNA pseudouridine synthase [Oscillospiraceae bacterium]
MERIDKLLANTGRWSRKDAKELIRAGRVTAGGRHVLRAEEKCEADDIRVDGEPLTCGQNVYLMMNKPTGVLSATEDSRQPTVLDLLPEHLRRVGLFPVGRLDKDTEGLLLLTNDGALAHGLLSPKRHVDKVYLARTEGVVDEADVKAFAAGMTLGDGLVCQPAGLEPLPGENAALVTLREGKFHQVKRMLAARGKPVLALRRLSMGPLKLDLSLRSGQWRPLEASEIDDLCRAAGIL